MLLTSSTSMVSVSYTSSSSSSLLTSGSTSIAASSLSGTLASSSPAASSLSAASLSNASSSLQPLTSSPDEQATSSKNALKEIEDLESHSSFIEKGRDARIEKRQELVRTYDLMITHLKERFQQNNIASHSPAYSVIHFFTALRNCLESFQHKMTQFFHLNKAKNDVIKFLPLFTSLFNKQNAEQVSPEILQHITFLLNISFSALINPNSSHNVRFLFEINGPRSLGMAFIREICAEFYATNRDADIGYQLAKFDLLQNIYLNLKNGLFNIDAIELASPNSDLSFLKNKIIEELFPDIIHSQVGSIKQRRQTAIERLKNQKKLEAKQIQTIMHLVWAEFWGILSNGSIGYFERKVPGYQTDSDSMTQCIPKDLGGISPYHNQVLLFDFYHTMAGNNSPSMQDVINSFKERGFK